MLKLYGGARSRASLVRWYLEEIGVEYEFILLDMAGGEHLQEGYRSLNPFGKVPAIADGEFKLWESGAILLYLAEKYARDLQTVEDRAIATQWVLFANATLGPDLFNEAKRETEFPRLMQPLEAILSQQPFMLGDGFTVVDVAVGSYLFYLPAMLRLDLSPYPSVKAYVEKLTARPVFQRTMINR